MSKMKVMKKVLALAAAFLLLAALPQAAGAEGFAAIVTSSWMQVYSDSALKTPSGIITGGEVVSVTSYSGTTASITYKGVRGYARVSDMAKVSSYGRRAVVFSADANVYEAAFTNSESRPLKQGLEVYVLETFGEWARIVSGIYVGYTEVDALAIDPETPQASATPAPAPSATVTTSIPATVTAASVTVYASASTDSKVLGVMKKGSQMNVVDYNSKWAFVERNGRYGFCDIKALARNSDLYTPTPTASPSPTPTVSPTPAPAAPSAISVTVTADSVKVYASASTSSKLLGTMKKGSQMNLVDYDSAWAHVELNGKYGYCDIKALTRTADLQPSVTPYAKDNISAVVSASSVKVYDIPSTSGTCLGTMKKGTKVTVVDYTSTWAHVELNGKYGYCDIKALKKTEDPQPTAETVKFTATVVRDGTPMYASKSTESTVRAVVSAGTGASVYDYDDNWAYIGCGGEVKGYTLVKYLNRNSYEELSTGSTGDAVLKLQKALEALGYFDGVPGGNYSTLTASAVTRFTQTVSGLYDQASADQTMQRVLYGGYAPACSLLSRTLSKGDKGDDVYRLQTRLYNKGYLSKTGSLDSDYGSTTAAAVKLFQGKAGISQTGTADPATLKALYSNTAPALGNGTPADGSSGGSGGDNGTGTGTDTPGNNSKIETVIRAAKNQLGKPYVYGATGMSSFDCSGLTQYSFKQAGYSLNRTAYAQGYYDGKKISGLSNLVRGDIVCMNTIADSDLCDHVGIYLGGGQMIHASSGAGKVIISSLNSGYYNRVFSWGRRIIQ